MQGEEKKKKKKNDFAARARTHTQSLVLYVRREPAAPLYLRRRREQDRLGRRLHVSMLHACMHTDVGRVPVVKPRVLLCFDCKRSNESYMDSSLVPAQPLQVEAER